MDKGEKMAFLQASLDTQRRYKEHLDQKASILLGISGVIFVLSISNMEQIGFLVIAVFSLLSCILNVWVISFPFKKHRRGKYGFMCYLGFYDLDFKEYGKQLKAILNSKDGLVNEYATEIYSLAEHSIKFKTKLIRNASFILSLGLVIGLVLLFIEW